MITPLNLKLMLLGELGWMELNVASGVGIPPGCDSSENYRLDRFPDITADGPENFQLLEELYATLSSEEGVVYTRYLAPTPHTNFHKAIAIALAKELIEDGDVDGIVKLNASMDAH